MGHTILPQENTTSLRLVSGVPSVRISVTGIQYLTSIANILLPSTGLVISILLIEIGNVAAVPDGAEYADENNLVPTTGHDIDHILLPASLHPANSAHVPRYHAAYAKVSDRVYDTWLSVLPETNADHRL